jgi:hypothetical protein
MTAPCTAPDGCKGNLSKGLQKTSQLLYTQYVCSSKDCCCWIDRHCASSSDMAATKLHGSSQKSAECAAAAAIHHVSRKFAAMSSSSANSGATLNSGMLRVVLQEQSTQHSTQAELLGCTWQALHCAVLLPASSRNSAKLTAQVVLQRCNLSQTPQPSGSHSLLNGQNRCSVALWHR